MSFRELKIYYLEKNYHLDDKSMETNLNLRNENGDYNLLAELLSDRNNIPFIFVKFQGINKSSISQRSDYGYGCLLTTYEKIKNRLQADNICISDTTVRPRRDIYLFDYDSVNEAIINALVYDDWTITEPQISMFQDRLEILSHGGLPSWMTDRQFFEGISKPRNATLMRIFLNMGLTEHTGHGIPTIVSKYGTEVFEIESNYIRCTIPFNKQVLLELNKKIVREDGVSYVTKNDSTHNNMDIPFKLSKTQKQVINLLIESPFFTVSEIAQKLGVSTRTVERAFKTLQEIELIKREGNNRKGKWIVL